MIDEMRRLLDAARPDCRSCGGPVTRVEQSWEHCDGEWRVVRMTLVCASGHRAPVEVPGG